MTHKCMYQWRGVRRWGQRKCEKASLNRKVSIVRHVETIAAKYLDSGKVRSESGRWQRRSSCTNMVSKKHRRSAWRQDRTRGVTVSLLLVSGLVVALTLALMMVLRCSILICTLMRALRVKGGGKRRD
jgi:Flp pilus assembly protein TadB